MVNLTEAFYKLVENCSTQYSRISIRAHPEYVYIFVGSDTDSSALAQENSYNTTNIWNVLAGVLKNFSDLVVQNCKIVSESNAFTSTNRAALGVSDNGENKGVGIFAGGFVTGVVAAGLIVASCCFLRKYMARVRNREQYERMQIVDACDGEVKMDQNPNVILNNSNSERVEIGKMRLL
ncbi:hypothetical protein K6025_05215 [Ehrlichia sp. JZT12]